MAINQGNDFFIQWHLTERCNLRCAHCYQTEGRTEELTLTEITETVEEVAAMLEAWTEAYSISFSPSFNITGGEPFLRKDIFVVLETIAGRGFAVYLLSNGTLIDREKAKRLAGLGISGVQISIEGPETVHDRIRGEGSFSASLRGVACLLDAGLTVTLNATLSEINEGTFLETVALARSVGVQRLGFSRLVPSGRGARLAHRMIPKRKVREIYERIFALDTGGLEIVTGDPVAAQFKTAGHTGKTSDFPSAGCAAGLSGLTFLPDGTIVPCRRLFIPVGNLRHDSLREVWATSDVLNALRDKRRYTGKCGDCRRWAVCRGCRAIAYAYSRTRGGDDFLSEDPQCFIGE
jgi:radical SAM protein with 4Fe4S-binding SPASM domain